MISNYKQLYQDVILEHNKKPRNFGELSNPSHAASGHNPLCGDHLRLTLRIADAQISEIGFNGESCAICKASASLMSVAVKGKSPAAAEKLISDFLAMIKGSKTLAELNNLGHLAVFSGISAMPSRVKCAILPWHTLRAALNSEATASTEAEHDPLFT